MSDPMTPERLRDQIAEKLAEWAFQAAEAKSVKLTNFHRHVIEQEAPVRADMVMTVVRPELERLRAELAETTYVLEVTGEKLTAVRGQRNRAEAERDRIRLAWDSARRGRRSARLLNRELIASMGVLHGRLQQYMDDKNTAAAHFTNQYSRMHLERDQMRTERDAAREQVKDAERAVHAYFVDADQRGVHLDGMTVDELCDAVMAAIREGTGQ